MATLSTPASPPLADRALALGALGVLAFSLTLPATRASVPALGGVFVGLGRQVVAGALAATWLATSRASRPARGEWRALGIVAFGVGFGFPLLSALAMRSLPAAHGIVVSGLVPAVTACMAAWRSGERPPAPFWLACALGAVAVLAFAAVEGAGRPQPGDLLLAGAVVSVALGYAEGARLARAWGAGGGVRVISWALVIAAPIAALVLAITSMLGAPRALGQVPAGAWLGFAYVSVVSAYLGYFPWYAGLARGGVARVAQVQLLQPVLGLAWAALLLGEPLHARTVAAAGLVIAAAAAALVTRAGAAR